MGESCACLDMLDASHNSLVLLASQRFVMDLIGVYIDLGGSEGHKAYLLPSVKLLTLALLPVLELPGKRFSPGCQAE